MKHLSESVARKTTGKYLENWDTKEGIVSILMSNGFKEVEAKNDFQLKEQSEKNRNARVFSVGPYDPGAPSSHWIKFYDPNASDKVFFCREKEILGEIHGRTYRLATIEDGSWTEIYDFDKFVETANKLFRLKSII